jgi:putative Mn2+ efflux pump MntP
MSLHEFAEFLFQVLIAAVGALMIIQGLQRDKQ